MVVALSDDILEDAPFSGDSTAKMAARATLTCRPNSHPFQERNLNLTQPVKIGRSVAHARPALNNAIFDCKVLSRNHALLWYEEGKFYLQDTKSSNGTFVNNQRLSKASEDSSPREVFSGDIVQFGVDVMENTRKVTHGCIVATVKLYHPDGKEAKANPSQNAVSSFGMVPLDDLYQLNQYLNDSLQREQLLEKKLASLQKWVENTSEASELCWKALIDEDRLLSRVENLENQLQIYSKNFPEDKLREELRKLQEDKIQYEEIVKESIQKMLQEKAEAVRKYEDLERILSDKELEYTQLQKMKESSEHDLLELAQKYNQQLQTVDDLSLKLFEREEEGKEVRERLEQDKLELVARLEEQREIERSLQERLDDVSKEGEFRKHQLALLQSRIVAMQTERLEEDVTRIVETGVKETDSTAVQVDASPEDIEPMEVGVENDTEKEMERLRCQLKKSEEHLKENQVKVDELNLRLEESRSQERIHTETTSEMEARLQELKMELCKLPSEGESGDSSISGEAAKLTIEIVKLEGLLDETRAKERDAGSRVVQIQLELDSATTKVKENEEDLTILKEQMVEIQVLVAEKTTTSAQQEAEMKKLTSISSETKQHVAELEEKLHIETERADRQAEIVVVLQQQLLDAQQAAVESQVEVEQVKDHMKALHEDSTDELMRLRGQCGTLQEDVERLKRECSLLKEKDNSKVPQEDHTEVTDLHEVPSSVDSESTLQQDDATSAELQVSPQEPQQPDDDHSEMTEELEKYRKMHADDCQKVQSLEEELVRMKERYLHCNEEMAQLSKDLNNLRHEYNTLATISPGVPVKYLIPLALIVAAVIMSSGLFNIF